MANALPILLAAGAAYFLMRGKDDGAKGDAGEIPANLRLPGTSDEYLAIVAEMQGPGASAYTGSVSLVTPTPDDEYLRKEMVAAAKQVPDVLFMMYTGELASAGWEKALDGGQASDGDAAVVALMSQKTGTRAAPVKVKTDVPKAVIGAIQTLKS